MAIKKVKVVSVSSESIVCQRFWGMLPLGYISASRGVGLENANIKIGQWVYVDTYWERIKGVSNE